MANIRDWHFKQRVTEAEIDSALGDLETADLNVAVDHQLAQQADATGTPITSSSENALFGGIVNGLKPGTPATLKIPVGKGTCYDPQGRRINVPIDVEIDATAAGDTPVGVGGSTTGGPLTVPSAGEFRWLTLMILFDRNLSDPRIDGNAQEVFFKRDESFKFRIKIGASFANAGPDVLPAEHRRPPPDPNTVIIGDFLRNTTGIFTEADGDVNKRPRFNRRGDLFRANVDPLQPVPVLLDEPSPTDPTEANIIRRGLRDVLLKLRARLSVTTSAFATHISTTAPTGKHKAKNIDYEAGPNWADGATNPAKAGGGLITDGLQGQIDSMISRLASTTGGNDGISKIGTETITTGPFTLGPGTVGAALNDLLAFLNNHINGTGVRHIADAIDVAAITGAVYALTADDLQAVLVNLVGQLNTRDALLPKLNQTNIFTPDEQFFNGGGLNAEAAMIVDVAQPGIDDKKQLLKFALGNAGKYIRLYAEKSGTDGTGSYAITINASWIGTAWAKDIAGESAHKFSFHDGGGSNGHVFSAAFKRGGSVGTWGDGVLVDSTTDWEGQIALKQPFDGVADELSETELLSGGDLLVNGKGAETTLRASISGVATGAGQVFAYGLTFRHKFGAPPILVSSTPIGASVNAVESLGAPDTEGVIWGISSVGAGPFSMTRLLVYRTA